MKKLFSIMVMALAVVLIPMNVKAVDTFNVKCGEADSNGNITCTFTVNVQNEIDTATITLTENGGAEISDISEVTGSDWTLTKSEANNVWTVNASTLEPVSGEQSILKFTYKHIVEDKDGECYVEVAYNGQKKTTPNTPTPNKQTGATLPYIALGVIVLGATGAYLTTRNKSKMYKI